MWKLASQSRHHQMPGCLTLFACYDFFLISQRYLGKKFNNIKYESSEWWMSCGDWTSACAVCRVCLYLWANIQQRTTMRSPAFPAYPLRLSFGGCVCALLCVCVCVWTSAWLNLFTLFFARRHWPTHNFILKCLPKRQFHSFFSLFSVVFHSRTYGTKPGPHY